MNKRMEHINETILEIVAKNYLNDSDKSLIRNVLKILSKKKGLDTRVLSAFLAFSLDMEDIIHSDYEIVMKQIENQVGYLQYLMTSDMTHKEVMERLISSYNLDTEYMEYHTLKYRKTHFKKFLGDIGCHGVSYNDRTQFITVKGTIDTKVFRKKITKDYGIHKIRVMYMQT